MALRATLSLRPFLLALCAAGAVTAAPAWAQSKVYVSSEKDNKIYVFDT